MLRRGDFRGIFGLVAAALLLAALAGCGSKTASKPAVGEYKVGKPYQINGVWYYPKEDWEYREKGIASWYGPGFHGKRTANGEIYNENDLTAAHPTLPMPVMVQVTNLENGRSLKVRINDRGPFANGRVIDLSRRSAQLLGFETQGTAKVLVEILPDETRQLVAAAQRQTADTLDMPEAAPVGVVDAKPLGGSVPAPGGSPSPAPLAPKPQPALTPAPVPQPTGVIEQRPVVPTQIFIQAGSFANPANAEGLRARLVGFGPTVFIAQVRIGTQDFYRVRLGPIAGVEEADRVLARLIAAGHTDSRVVVD